MSRRYDDKEVDANIFLLFVLAAVAIVMVVMWPKYADATDFPETICVDNDWQRFNKCVPLFVQWDSPKEQKAKVRTVSHKGIEFIKQHEGFNAYRYKDSAGLWTIGYGHLIKKGEAYKHITHDMAERLLKRDIKTVEKAINKLVKVKLTQSQYDAVASFVFNVGEGAFKRSTMLYHINRSNYGVAANEFVKWVNAGGQRVNGLVKRRKAERRMFAMR